MDRQRLRLQVLIVLIHPDASRESAGWFHGHIPLSFRGGQRPSPESINTTCHEKTTSVMPTSATMAVMDSGLSLTLAPE